LSTHMEGNNTQGYPQFCSLEEILPSLNLNKTLLVSDLRIYKLYGAKLAPIPYALVPVGEEAKTLEALTALLEDFVRHKIDRSWTILALGGGSVSDVAGFAAHIWMRGIGFYVAPTTLLAMCDASLGGKNGLDFQGYKNVIGSFHFPGRIFCDVQCLRSLDPVQFASGMAEAVKHAILDGEEHFSFLERSHEAYGRPDGLDYGTCPIEVLQRIVSLSQKVKLDIVAQDPKESSKRRLLNLGHSFGHAIESATGLPHGHAVAIGIGLASSFSAAKGWLAQKDRQRILGLLARCGLPSSLDSIDESGSIRQKAAELFFMDKKREGDFLRYIIPEGIGSVKIHEVPVHELLRFFLEDNL